MTQRKLDILVLLRETCDPRPPARVITRGAGISERGLRRMPNPADLSALEEALCLKDRTGAAVTVLAVGPERIEDTLRVALAMGADRGIRFWDHGLERGDAVAEARVLARIMVVLAPTLFFTGNRLVDRGDDPVPALAAAAVGRPCIATAVSLTLAEGGVETLRKGDRGARQIVTSPFPCTVLFEGERIPRYPSMEAITGSLAAPVERWELADLGLPFWVAGAAAAYLPTAGFGVPRPDPVRVATPDATLPAFERILSLLSGGIKAREGKTHLLSVDETAAGLWRILGEEGLIPGAS